jgi:DUF4097 and DUF4098 domain-containing protein YvlB
MLRRLLLLPLAAISLALSGCDFEDFHGGGESSRFKEDFNFSFPLKPGGRIDLESFNGSVEISGWDKDSVEITGQKYAATEALLHDLKIDIVPSADSLRIRTVRPTDRRGNMGARYVLHVPRRVMLERIISSNGGVRVTDVEGEARLRTSNGGINITSLKGNLDANTSNGGVDVRGLDGTANLRTSNGGIRVDHVRGSFEAVTSNAGIDARLTDIDPARLVRLETSNGNINLTMDRMKGHQVRANTSNGSITVKLPAETSAHVRANTSNSSITSDFDVTVRGSFNSKSRLEGVIGSGEGTLDLGSSNGSIRLLKL